MANKKCKDVDLLVIDSTITRKMLTDGQRGADDTIDGWRKKKKTRANQVLRIGGCAGSGKTYFLQYLIQKHEYNLVNCMVMAYTGQAVSSLRQNGIMARTIYASIMTPREMPLIKNGKPIIRSGVPITVTKYVPVRSLPSEIEVIIIDEGSFVNEALMDILMGYGVPILIIGDPEQLPPVTGKPSFLMTNLDYFIEGIMRQEKDSEIIKLATAIRHQQKIDTRDFGTDVRFLYAQPTIEETFYRFLPFMKKADMIITSTNKQRQIINDLYRKEIVKARSPFPVEGERLICRKNDWNLTIGPYPLTNGTQGICMNPVGRSMVDKNIKGYYMDFQPDVVSNDYYDNLLCDSDFLLEPYGPSKLEDTKHNPAKKFEYAHAITTHLSQGAQYDNVLFMDSFNSNTEYLRHIQYTAATRARKRLVYVIPYSAKNPGWFNLRKWGNGYVS